MDALPTGLRGLKKGCDRMSVAGPRDVRDLPILLTVAEVAALLRRSRPAVYAMISRGQLPGVIRKNRSLLVERNELLVWLFGSRAPSPEEER